MKSAADAALLEKIHFKVEIKSAASVASLGSCPVTTSIFHVSKETALAADFIRSSKVCKIQEDSACSLLIGEFSDSVRALWMHTLFCEGMNAF